MAAFAGLLRALSRYDPKIGKFSTFAYWWILKFILKQREFDQNLVRIPLTLVRRHRKVRQLIEAGYSLPQAAKKLGLSLVAAETIYGLYDIPHCVALDHAAFSESPFDAPYTDVTSERVATMQAQLKKLPPKLRTAVTLRYRNSGDRSFTEIGRRMNCCAESARRYCLAGLQKLKQLIEDAESVD
jgi:RNA polymerase sigma factor (sigma-70 family)